jgi:hypothetical protein
MDKEVAEQIRKSRRKEKQAKQAKKTLPMLQLKNWLKGNL